MVPILALTQLLGIEHVSLYFHGKHVNEAIAPGPGSVILKMQSQGPHLETLHNAMF